jgi:beta-N-acetylhexosaminidase
MRRIIHLIIALTLLFPTSGGVWANPLPRPVAQTGTVVALLSTMTPAEKVGQLFLVTFYGPSAAAGTDIERLVTQYHVGGLVLSAANDNITDTVNTPLQVLTLTNQLQSAALAASQIPRDTPGQSREISTPPFIPLFIAIQHEGDGYPFTAIRSGLTELPDAMAIGATWDPAQAEAIGRIAGEELAALGVNLLLGPSLDVLDTPRPQGTGDLGTRVFGGDPYWVGVLGQAYIRGVHAGAGKRLAVVAKHFPGLGSSDRNPDEDQDVPTVRKLLEQLKQNELAPFFAVTGGITDTTAMADALLTTHIRFVGFQGNPRQTTRPISFDEQTLGQLLALPEIAAWRNTGGVTVSDALGVRAVKRFYDPSERAFNNKRIAREAFAAGNDLLYLSEFGLSPRNDQTNTIIDTITYFTQQYEADPVFADKVDAAVARLLTLKLRLNGGAFDASKSLRSEADLAALGQSEAAVRTVAQNAATLVGLTGEEAAARLAEPPAPSERIVFFTDARQGRQCTACPAYPLLDKRALERAVLRLYGPAGSGQVREGNLLSFSFDELAAYLNAAAIPTPAPAAGTPTPEPAPLETALTQADWIVFNMLNVTPNVPASSVVSAFLAQRADLVRNKKVIVFGFNAPYYLDATDVSKLTAFYALYGKSPVFVDVAARLLFRELTPRGALPVSVQSVGYDLARATAPDPNQLIEIFIDRPQPGPGTPTPQAPVEIKKGEVLHLRTGVIRDLNGHPVPDGTPVQFSILYEEDALPAVQPASTKDGVASTDLPLNRVGKLKLTASSEPAFSSSTLDITVGDIVLITVITPTPRPTDTPPPTDTPIPATPTVTVEPTQTPKGPPPSPAGRVVWRDFIMMCLGLASAMLIGYRLGDSATTRSQRFRVALAGAIGVLAGYNFFALALPGAEAASQRFGILAATICVIIGALLGLVTGWYWFVRRVM